jgi:hypothetical protein
MAFRSRGRGFDDNVPLPRPSQLARALRNGFNIEAAPANVVKSASYASVNRVTSANVYVKTIELVPEATEQEDIFRVARK